MSEFLRPTTPRPEVRAGGPLTLARLAHQAEDTDDDLLLLELMDECDRREQLLPGSYRAFHTAYLMLLADRARARRHRPA